MPIVASEMRTGSTYVSEVLSHTLFATRFIYLNEAQYRTDNQLRHLSKNNLVKIHHLNYSELTWLIPRTTPVFVPVRNPLDVYVSAIHFASFRQGKPLLQAIDELESVSWVTNMWTRMKSFIHVQDKRLVLLRYEQFIYNPRPTLETALLSQDMTFNQRKLSKSIERFSFNRKTGRSFGEENPHSHERNGKSGQWRTCNIKEVYEKEPLANEYESLWK